MSKLDHIAAKIIKEQELIIGPIAWQEAGKVGGLKVVDQKQGTVSIEGADPKIVIDGLIAQYEKLFGRASREVCREVAAPFIADLQPSEIPLSLSR
jgi:hypothetical protein